MAFDLESLVRDNIKDLVPYSSARSEYSGGAKIFLDANENAYGSASGAPYSRYPDPVQSEIKQLLARENAISPEHIFIANGSDEAIDLLIRIFCRPGIDGIITCPPTYGMYAVAAQINEVAVKRVGLIDGFQLDTRGIQAAFEPTAKMVFLCSPNNPTGNLLETDALLQVVKRFKGIVVIDEAYIHYANGMSMIGEIGNHPNLIVLQTFSKAWGLAGLRVGAAFASEPIVRLLNKIKLPYNVSSAAQLLIIEALQNSEGMRKRVARTIDERVKLAAALCRFSAVERVHPSDANFLLVQVVNSFDLYNFLLASGVVVRDRSNASMCDGCLRITVGTPKENEILIQKIEEYEASLIHRP